MKNFMKDVVCEGLKEFWDGIKGEIFPILFVGICCGINFGILMLLYTKGFITDLTQVVSYQSVFATVMAYRVGKSVGKEE